MKKHTVNGVIAAIVLGLSLGTANAGFSAIDDLVEYVTDSYGRKNLNILNLIFNFHRKDGTSASRPATKLEQENGVMEFVANSVGTAAFDAFTNVITEGSNLSNIINILDEAHVRIAKASDSEKFHVGIAALLAHSAVEKVKVNEKHMVEKESKAKIIKLLESIYTKAGITLDLHYQKNLASKYLNELDKNKDAGVKYFKSYLAIRNSFKNAHAAADDLFVIPAGTTLNSQLVKDVGSLRKHFDSKSNVKIEISKETSTDDLGHMASLLNEGVATVLDINNTRQTNSDKEESAFHAEKLKEVLLAHKADVRRKVILKLSKKDAINDFDKLVKNMEEVNDFTLMYDGNLEGLHLPKKYDDNATFLYHALSIKPGPIEFIVSPKAGNKAYVKLKLENLGDADDFKKAVDAILENGSIQSLALAVNDDHLNEPLGLKFEDYARSNKTEKYKLGTKTFEVSSKPGKLDAQSGDPSYYWTVITKK